MTSIFNRIFVIVIAVMWVCMFFFLFGFFFCQKKSNVQCHFKVSLWLQTISCNCYFMFNIRLDHREKRTLSTSLILSIQLYIIVHRICFVFVSMWRGTAVAIRGTWIWRLQQSRCFFLSILILNRLFFIITCSYRSNFNCFAIFSQFQ